MTALEPDRRLALQARDREGIKIAIDASVLTPDGAVDGAALGAAGRTCRSATGCSKGWLRRRHVAPRASTSRRSSAAWSRSRTTEPAALEVVAKYQPG